MRTLLVIVLVTACSARQTPVVTGGGAPAPSSSAGWSCRSMQSNDSNFTLAECERSCPDVSSNMHATSDCAPQDVAYCYSFHDDEGGDGSGHDGTLCTPTADECAKQSGDEGNYLFGETTVTSPCAATR
jgi:hypothetical protein